MKTIFSFISLLSALALFTSCSDQAAAPQQDEDQPKTAQAEEAAFVDKAPARIISLSGLLTETLYDLGLGNNIVGVDITSVYPEAVNELPKLGHISKLNAEGIIALNPEVIFVEEDQVSQAAALKQLESSKIDIVKIPTKDSLYNYLGVLQALKSRLNIPSAIMDAASQSLASDVEALRAFTSQQKYSPKVLFIYARGAGRLMIGGVGTGASEMIRLAGGQNAIQSIEGYQALTPEALLEAAPDAILMFNSGLVSLDGKEGLSQIPGISETPAYKDDRIITMDGHYLTSFGPRTAQAALDLAKQIHTSK
jgi:iron complex transport system substrate-binding protein